VDLVALASLIDGLVPVEVQIVKLLPALLDDQQPLQPFVEEHLQFFLQKVLQLHGRLVRVERVERLE